MDRNKMIKKIEEEFGSRIGFLLHQITTLSMTGQPCDITFFKEAPLIDVKIASQITLALMYGMGPTKLQEMLCNIKLSNGDSVNINKILVINPMPTNGFSKEELDAIDMSKAEKKTGPNDETLRKMIKDTYHCESKEDED